MGKFSFPRQYRLSDRESVRHAFKKFPFFERRVKLFVVSNCLEYNRYMVTFRRNFGTAVKRNRIRRCSREVLRHLHPLLKQGYDMVFLFTDPQIVITTNQNPLSVLLRKAHLFRD